MAASSFDSACTCSSNSSCVLIATEFINHHPLVFENALAPPGPRPHHPMMQPAPTLVPTSPPFCQDRACTMLINCPLHVRFQPRPYPPIFAPAPRAPLPDARGLLPLIFILNSGPPRRSTRRLQLSRSA